MKDAPTRAVRTIAVISGPSSFVNESATMPGTSSSCPNFFMTAAVWSTRIAPIRNETSATIGSDFTPTFRMSGNTSVVGPGEALERPDERRGRRVSQKRCVIPEMCDRTPMTGRADAPEERREEPAVRGEVGRT